MDRESVDELIRCLTSADTARRRAAIGELAEMSVEAEKAAPEIAKRLIEHDREVIEDATIALLEMGTAAVAHLMYAMRWALPYTRVEIYPIIHEQRGLITPLASEIARHLRNNDYRPYAARFLASIGIPGAKLLLEALRDEEIRGNPNLEYLHDYRHWFSDEALRQSYSRAPLKIHDSPGKI